MSGTMPGPRDSKMNKTQFPLLVDLLSTGSQPGKEVTAVQSLG